MKYIEGFREPRAARALVEKLRLLGQSSLKDGNGVTFMEVCGSHTMAIARYAIREALPEGVALVSGPGCPVCVTPAGYLDAAIELARQGVIMISFGDMLHVPGSRSSLARARAAGGDIRVVYSALDALQIAAAEPQRECVFLAIGFETTTAPVAGLVPLADERKIGNLSLLTSFKTIPPAMDALIADPELRIDGFMCPAHVSAIIGADAYLPYARQHGIPCVVAGFEPLDILLGIEGLLRQIIEGRAEVENQYSRVVTAGGNRRAQVLFQRLLEPEDALWRGLGVIPASGLRLKKAYSSRDAAVRFGVTIGPGVEHAACCCGDVIKGKLNPAACPLFAKVCTPDDPVGPCMVSAEGSCAAAYKFRDIRQHAY